MRQLALCLVFTVGLQLNGFALDAVTMQESQQVANIRTHPIRAIGTVPWARHPWVECNGLTSIIPGSLSAEMLQHVPSPLRYLGCNYRR